MKTFRKGGIHPQANKLTDHSPIREVEAPEEVTLFLSQCIGAPAVPVVKAGDIVTRYQMVAKAGGFVSAPVHTPISGKVKKIEPVRDAQGLWKDAIIVAADPEVPAGEHPQPRTPQEVAAMTAKEIVAECQEMGIVGLGGATFPTHVKLSPPEGKVPTVVIINGAECEPYLTCDDLLMQSAATEILQGAQLLMRAVNVDKCIVGIEENKPEAIARMREAASEFTGIEIVPLKKKYPQGGEKQLIQALTGREVPDGGLPVDVGAIVDNVATAYALRQAIYERIPLVERVVTVTGKCVTNPGNFRVPTGMDINRLIDLAGGVPENAVKVIGGGPMMGRAMSQTDTPTTKGLSGILFLSANDTLRKEMRNCIRCGACINVCPMGLEPYLFINLGINAMWEEMKEHHAMSCVECGSCVYTCPANRPILDYIRLSKSEIRKMPKK